KGGLSTEKGGTGGAAFGAGLANAGILLLTNCTLSENIAGGGTGGDGGKPTTGRGGDGGLGGSAHGASVSQDSGSAIITSCTISGNQSLAGSGGVGATGGGTLGPGGANSGGVFSAGNVQVENCIMAGNSATNYPDVDGTVQSGGFNLVGISDGSTGWLVAEAGNLGNSSFPINPKLGPLQNNGGTTPTLALLSGSPAVDQGESFSLATDQRNFARPEDNVSIANASGGDGSDIGAYEVVVAPTPPVLSSTVYGNQQFQFLLTGQPGANYAIQVTTNLVSANWSSIFTNISPFTFVESNANSFTRRFYRGVSSP
ncbi:MAG TPA: choice-of-anchor Q domain-containing protein, partial [Verrucomicrobiae bacterium]|nr:choice-of-anchor Q domain-containing protein [Verrucomicrobiae bacterium]